MFREDDSVRYKKKRKAKRLANQSFNYSAFLMASFIPTAWVLVANSIQYLMRGELSLQPHRLVAVATGVVWGGIVAWITNVPQVLYFFRPGGRNRKQRWLFILSVLGVVISLSALALLGVTQMSQISDDPVLTYVVASCVFIGLLPIMIGCAKYWRHIYLTDPRGVYIAYTGQVLQPNILYRTGLTWKTPALEHHLESEESKIHPLRFKDGVFELRYDAVVSFPETPIASEECRLDPVELYKSASDFLLRHLQAQCVKYTGMQCMKMQPGLKPVEEYVEVAALKPKGYKVPIRMQWSGKFKLSDV
ncbi:MAG TPA: hypothetical protein VJ810_28435 [Blastocatellia bacterium]|nr:hypothetical protein [Blastocatellia bacterium]